MKPTLTPEQESKIHSLINLHSQCLVILHYNRDRFDWKSTMRRYKIRQLMKETMDVLVCLVPRSFERETFITYGKKYVGNAK